MAKTQEEDHLPTPPVGWPVVWYKGGNPDIDKPVAALVVEVEAPGRLWLQVFEKNSTMVKQIRGVRYIDDPALRSEPEKIRARSGGWDFVNRELVPRGIYDLSKQFAARRLAAQQQSQQLSQQAQEPASAE